VNSRLRRPRIPTCFAQATSLPTIHLCNLSISIKMTFLLKMDTICFSHIFPLFGVTSYSKSNFASLEDWPFNIFSTFSLFMFPPIKIENDTNNGPNMKDNKWNNGLNRAWNEHLTILTT
jgi:hypothetical protein